MKRSKFSEEQIAYVLRQDECLNVNQFGSLADAGSGSIPPPPFVPPKI